MQLANEQRKKVFACGSPYGAGGIGQHFAQLVESARDCDELDRYYAKRAKPGDALGHDVASTLAKWTSTYTPVRFSPGWTNYVNKELADRAVARHLARPIGSFVGFAGESLHCFRRARAEGAAQLELVSANSHANNLQRLHEQAAHSTGIRDTWLSALLHRKMLREYEMADIIHVHSEYVRQSFLDEGVSAHKLQRMYLEIDNRFRPAPYSDDGVFRVVYVGRIDATKGLPLLLQAFSELATRNAELCLVGGWSTRGMKVYMKQWLDRDDRITVAPGDPVSVLQQADVFVHPTFEDGFGYAPMEALACGVPAIVTEDTGMKEYVAEGKNGYIVPTGDWKAILECMRRIRQHPLRSAHSHLNVKSAA